MGNSGVNQPRNLKSLVLNDNNSAWGYPQDDSHSYRIIKISPLALAWFYSVEGAGSRRLSSGEKISFHDGKLRTLAARALVKSKMLIVKVSTRLIRWQKD
jgi:hypothetical protein